MSDAFSVRSRVREYRVEFIDGFHDDIRAKMKDNFFLVMDEKIKELHASKLEGLCLSRNVISVKANEESKTLAGCNDLIKALLHSSVRKNSMIFAVGGGVVQDMVSFVSMVLFRGIEWFFYPTTLLAQADSCIGSKSSINFMGYKNILGSFYPPSFIGIDAGFLETLPAEEIKSGIGEILHFYFIAGKLDIAEKMMDEYEHLIEDPENMQEYIVNSLKIKKPVVEEDELDKGIRNLFNYGHTFAHAVESITSYKINHGQAVTLGMDMANYLSMKAGYIDKKLFGEMHDILKKNIPAFRLSEDNIEDYIKALSRDKKNVGSDLGCILTKGPGAMFKEYRPMDKALRADILSYFGD
ncbi:MAG: AroB-related putative sugar phosphate phospholyase (cyclizing) [Candidatus Omnitrophota bacterium]